MQDKSLIVYSFVNSFQLRRIGDDRQYDVRWRQLFVHIRCVYFFCCGFPFYLSVDEAGHNLVLNQFVGIVVNIIPHDELVEREDAQNRLLFHVPFTLVLNAVADNGIDQFDVNAAFIGGQRV